MARNNRRPTTQDEKKDVQKTQESLKRELAPTDLLDQAKTPLQMLYDKCRENGDAVNAGAVAAAIARIDSLGNRFTPEILAPGEVRTTTLDE